MIFIWCVIKDVLRHRLSRSVRSNTQSRNPDSRHVVSGELYHPWVSEGEQRTVRNVNKLKFCDAGGPTQNMIQARCSRITRGMLAKIHFAASEYGICGLDVLFSCRVIERSMKALTRVTNQVGVRMKFTTSTDGSADIDGTNCALIICLNHHIMNAQKLYNSPGRGISNHRNTLILQIHRAWPLCRVK